MHSFRYPPAPRTHQVDDYHGTEVADPFRILEDADAPATQEWIERENELTRSVLEKVPGRALIQTHLSNLWNYPRFADFHKAGGSYFYFHNSGLQNQAVWFVAESIDGEPRVLIDPNTWREDGTAALNGMSVSWNGKLAAYAMAQAGSDWNEWRVRDVATGVDLPDIVRWSKSGGPAWAPDDSGFYYARFPEPAANEFLTAVSRYEKIYLHKLGEDQSLDRLVYERPDHPDWLMAPMVMEGSQVLVIYIQTEVWGMNLLVWADLEDPSGPLKSLIDTPGNSYDPIALAGSRLYLRTNAGAPRGRVIALDLGAPARENWIEIVAERTETLESAQMVSGRILLSYMKDARSAACVVTASGDPVCNVAMPGMGTARWSGAGLDDDEMFFSFTSYTAAPAIYRFDLSTGTSRLIRGGGSGFDSDRYETRQVFYQSRDGTRVPMFVSARKDLALDGAHPTVLYGYGGFEVPLTPGFAPYIAAWLEQGGVWAVANLRGGSEYGEAWHRAGMRENKQNVFDDFIAAAEALVAEGWTSTERLAIFGGSNGGLLVGAVLNQRPDLFGAAMPAVGVMDMLRFQKFGFGAQWTGEYGSSENAEDFPLLFGYSPLHNIRKGVEYPAVLITTADHDDRVMPGHSLKYAATLQEAQAGTAPILLRVETRAGHGAGKPTSKSIEEWTDRLAFLRMALGT